MNYDVLLPEFDPGIDPCVDVSAKCLSAGFPVLAIDSAICLGGTIVSAGSEKPNGVKTFVVDLLLESFERPCEKATGTKWMLLCFSGNRVLRKAGHRAKHYPSFPLRLRAGLLMKHRSRTSSGDSIVTS